MKAPLLTATAYTDGSLRASILRAGIGGVIKSYPDEKIMYSFSEVWPYVESINEIEYAAVTHAAQWALDHNIGIFWAFTDSLLVANQINAVFSVRAKNLVKPHRKLTGMLQRFGGWCVTAIPREMNTEADALAGEATGRDSAKAAKRERFRNVIEEVGFSARL